MKIRKLEALLENEETKWEKKYCQMRNGVIIRIVLLLRFIFFIPLLFPRLFEWVEVDPLVRRR